jgi:mRNA interferase RelE/StbE
MAYAVTVKASAIKQIDALPKPMAKRVLARVESLGQEPRPPGCVKLKGASSLWRIRIGDYRVVYAIDETTKTIDVRIVAHRREVYRDV